MKPNGKVNLILEKQGRKIWGRVLVNNNLVVDSAYSIGALESKIRKSLLNYEKIRTPEFEYVYDLTYFFESFSYLNQSRVAEEAGLHPSLVRQYSSGKKFPSLEQVTKIEKAIHAIGTELKLVKLTGRKRN